DVAEHSDIEFGFRVKAEVEHVAGDDARRPAEAGYRRIVHRRHTAGLQALLKFAREIQILVELALLLADAVIENGVFQRNSKLGREEHHRFDVAWTEVVAGGVFNIENADQLFLGDQRDAELGASLFVKFDVARISANVGHDNRLTITCGVANQAAIDGNIRLGDDLGTGQREAMLEILTAGVQQENGKCLVLDQLGEQFANATEQLVGIEYGIEFAADAVEQMQRFRLCFGGLFGFAEFLFAFAAIGDVAEKGSKKFAPIALDRSADGDFHGKFPPAAMASSYFHAEVSDRILAGFAKVFQCVTRDRRNDFVPQRAADGFLDGPAEGLRGFGVPGNDTALHIDANEGMGSRFENKMRKRLAVSETLDGVAAHPLLRPHTSVRRPVIRFILARKCGSKASATTGKSDQTGPDRSKEPAK